MAKNKKTLSNISGEQVVTATGGTSAYRARRLAEETNTLGQSIESRLGSLGTRAFTRQERDQLYSDIQRYRYNGQQMRGSGVRDYFDDENILSVEQAGEAWENTFLTFRNDFEPDYADNLRASQYSQAYDGMSVEERDAAYADLIDRYDRANAASKQGGRRGDRATNVANELNDRMGYIANEAVDNPTGSVRDRMNAQNLIGSGGSLEDPVVGAGENTKRLYRMQQSDRRADREAELTAQIDAVSARMTETARNGGARSPEYRQDDALIRSLVAELKQVRSENRIYERTYQTGDEYAALQDEADFDQYANDRDFELPSVADIEEWERRNDRSAWHTDAQGNVYDAYGDLVFDAYGNMPEDSYLATHTEPQIVDRLGMFLSMPEEERGAAANHAAAFDGDSAFTDIINQGLEADWDELTENEIAVYYTLLGSSGQADADRYLDELTPLLNRRGHQRRLEAVDNASALELIGMNVAAIPAATYTGAFAFVDKVVDALKGDGMNPYSGMARGQNFAEMVQEETSSRIAENHPGTILRGIGWSDVYGAGTSMLQSLLGASTLGGAYTIVMGMSAASSVAKDLYERGASDEQIALTSFAAGLAEYFFENIGIDNFFDSLSSSSVRSPAQFGKNILSQLGAEAAEELGTETTNFLVDMLVNNTTSETYDQIVQRMDETGESPLIAAAAVYANRAWHALAGGAMSGAGMGAISSTVGVANTRAEDTKAGRDFVRDGNNIAAYSQFAADLAQDSTENKRDLTRAARRGSKVTQQGEMSDRDLRRTGAVVRTVAKDIASRNAADFESVLVGGGMNARDAKYAAEILSVLPETKNASPEVIAELVGADNLLLIENLLNNPESTVYRRQLRADLAKVGHELDEEGNPVPYGTSKKKGEAQQPKATADVKLPTTVAAKVAQQDHEVSDDGKIIHKDTGNAVDIVGFEEGKDGKLLLKLSDGTSTASDSISYGSDDEAVVYETVLNMGVSAASAKTLIDAYEFGGNVSALDYAMGIEMAYRHGFYGMSDSTDGITESQRVAAYKAGRQDSEAHVQKAAQAVEKKAKKKPSSKRKEGKVHFDRGNRAFDDRREASLKMMGDLAKVLGVDFYIFESRLEDGKRVYTDAKGKTVKAPNGYYDPSDGSIHIDLNAGNDGKGVMMFTVAHELTHFIKQWSPAKFRTLADFLVQQYGDGKDIDALVAAQQKKARTELTYDQAFEEFVADSMETMLTDGTAVEKLAALQQQDASLADKIRSFIKKFVSKFRAVVDTYRGVEPLTTEGRYVASLTDALSKLEELYAEALYDASENYVGSGIQIDAETQSAAPVFSERTWTASEYVQEREKTAKILAAQLGVTQEDALRYIDSINSVARLIADDRARLDYDPNLDETASVLKPNSEYKWSVDMSTLCAKRLLFTGTFDAIQKAFPDRAFTSEEIVELRKMMMDRGYEVACGICYVESTRREIGRITQEFIERYKEAQRTGEPISRINSSGKAVALTQQGRTFQVEEGYTPTLADLNTTDIDLVKRDHPQVYEAYLAFMNARGQAKPKLLETRAEYKGEILTTFKSKSAVKSRNDAGGLRVQSFSDFEVAHLIDMMQIVMDMSRVGLMSQAYTKVPAFARAFGNTGIKINLSLIAKDSGLDADGNLIFDDVEGIDHEEAFAIREQFSQNVGTILVGKNDAHIIAAMADPRIDFVIPFHKSSWKESLYDALGLTGYDDYTSTQNEKYIDPSRGKIKNFQPSDYWDDTKTGDENAQIYLERCRADGRIPKFPQFQGYPGYWKLLIDFKMYDNDGVRAPQQVVRPVFDDATTAQILDEYKGGHRSLPVAQDVVKDFSAQVREQVRAQQGDKDLVALSYSERDVRSWNIAWDSDNHSSIKSQMLAHIDEINQMDSVADIGFDKSTGKTYADILDEVLRTKFGYKIVRADGATFLFDKGAIANLRRYVNSDEEAAAVITSPYVLKRGKPISGHKYHKDTQYPSVTYAAPVVINGERVNVAVVVLFGDKRRPHSLRVLMPSGNEYVIQKQKADPKRKWASPKGGVRSSTGSAGSTVAQNDSGVKYSDRDSEGRELSAEQQAFFRDSKARDDQGRLVRLYHGTESFGFTEFDKEKLDDGFSIFMTDEIAVAASYSGTPLVKSVMRDNRTDFASMSPEELVKWHNDNISWRRIELLSSDEVEQLRENAEKALNDAISAYRWYIDSMAEFFSGFGAEVTEAENNFAAEVNDYIDAYYAEDDFDRKARILGSIDMAVIEYEDVASKIGKGFAYLFNDSHDLKRHLEEVRSLSTYGEKVRTKSHSGVSYLNLEDVRAAMWHYEENLSSLGNYAVYANITNPFVINGNERDWDNLILPKKYRQAYAEAMGYDPGDGRIYVTTRDVVKIAKHLGHDGVIFREIIDVGSNNIDGDVSNVYVAFESNQVKDVDNLTPTSNPDIRYSERSVTPAPTFYSHMARVIDGIKQDRIGAASVVNYLRGKGVKAEEIKWSGIEAYLEGKKSVSKAELQEFAAGSMLQIEEETLGGYHLSYDGRDTYTLYDPQGNKVNSYTYTNNSFYNALVSEDGEEDYIDVESLKEAIRKRYGGSSTTRWEDYKLAGGSNYRELVFKMPNSTYSNEPMRGHWGEDAQGILAHARVQDFDTSLGKMLFVDEIQSDWHNAGNKHGYVSAELTQLIDEYTKVRAERIPYHNAVRPVVTYACKACGIDPDAGYHALLNDDWDDIPYFDEIAIYFSDKDLYNLEKDVELFRRHMDIKRRIVANGGKVSAAPDAPFKDNYQEYVMKHLLRMAAEQGYDAIGWTTADIQSERWSDQYAEGYRIEYDQQIPSFMRKYGKKWGAKVDRVQISGEDENSALAEKLAPLDPYDVDDIRWMAHFYMADVDPEFDEHNVDTEVDDSNPDELIVTITYTDSFEVFELTSSMLERVKTRGNNTGHTVWSMPITESMKDSVLYEGQPLYSERDDTRSTREILTDALEHAALTDAERKSIQQYRTLIGNADEMQARLDALNAKIRELTFTKGADRSKLPEMRKRAKELAAMLTKYDRKLLDLEATAPIRGLINAERKKAVEKVRAEGKEALRKERERSREKQREIIERNKASRANAVERRNRTAMRHKIRNVVDELNRLLLRGDKKSRVMLDLRWSVASVLDAVNMDTVSAERRIAALEAELQNTTDETKRAELITRIAHVRADGDRIRRRLDDLHHAYSSIINSNDPDLKYAHDAEVAKAIDNVATLVGDTPLRDMTMEQLEEVYKLYTMVLTKVRDANKTFAENLREKISTYGNRAMEELVNLMGRKLPADKFSWSMFKPVQAFEFIGSRTMEVLFNNVRKGEDVWATDIQQARAYKLAACAKYGFDSWDFYKQYDFESKTGRKFKLTLQEMMSLYAYSKRGEQAIKHLENGGFTFDESDRNLGQRIVDRAKGKKEWNAKKATAFNVSRDTLDKIIATLSPQQRAFVDEMQDYLSTVMGAKGNEVSVKMYGVKLFTEKHYFPLHSSEQFMERVREQNSKDGVKLRNAAFTQATIPESKNAVVLSEFMDVWSDHVNEMSMYHAFVLPLEDFYRVYNFRVANPAPGEADISVVSELENRHGKGAVAYVDQLLRDINGGGRSDPNARWQNAMVGKFKKAAVFASLSVVVQQPSAVARAFAVIDPKYFVGENIKGRAYDRIWDEVKHYAPVAFIKEMGYFDTNMGQSARDYLKAAELKTFRQKAKAVVSISDSSYRDELFSKLPALADEMTWCWIWNACKREVAAKYNVPKGSEEFMRLVGQRFTEVITKTQVYDSVLSRSQMMRSKDGLVKAATAFMAEPTTTLNMMVNAIAQKNRGRKGLGRTSAAVATSLILNALLVALPYAMRDDDEDETFGEKYVSSFLGSLLDGLNPLTYIPVIKDAWSVVQGYDIERADMSVVVDFYEGWDLILKRIKNDEPVTWKDCETFFGSIANLFGLPLKNISRDIRSIVNTIDTVKNGEDGTKTGMRYAIANELGLPKLLDALWGISNETPSNADQLYEAMISDDIAHQERVLSRFKDDRAAENAIRRSLRENDERIAEAAVARREGDMDTYADLVAEIVGEGHFSEGTVVAAVNAAISAMEDEKPSSAPSQPALFTNEDYFQSIMRNDNEGAKIVKDYLIEQLVEEGNLETEAEKSVASSFSTNVLNAYEEGTLDRQSSLEYLTLYGGKDADEAEKAVLQREFKLETGYSWSARDNAYRLGAISDSDLVDWIMRVEDKDEADAIRAVLRYDFINENPEYSDITTEQIGRYYSPIDDVGYSLDDAGIPMTVYGDYCRARAGCDGEKDANGDTIRNSVKNQVLQVIDSLPLSPSQKDALYFFNGWARKNLYQAPWH